jgi:hypothetical protein
MEIHLARSGRKLGKFSLDEVNQRLASGELQLTDLAWTKGSNEWTSLSTVAGIIPPGAGPIPPALPPLVSLTPTAPPPASSLSVVSLVCGVLSVSILPVITSLPAIICGHLAQGQVRHGRGRVGGQGFALTGLITGYAGLVLAILLALSIPVFRQGLLKAREAESLSHARQIAVASLAYAADHEGVFPPRLEELVPQYLPDSAKLVCPLSGPEIPNGYEYFGGKDSDPPAQVLLVSKASGRKGWRIIAHVNGSVEAAPYAPKAP